MSIHAVSAAFKYDCPSPSAKLVLLALANYADGEGNAYPSVDRIGSETGLSERTIRSALKALVECGAVSITTRRRRDGSQASSEYNLNIQGAADAPCGADRVQIMSLQGANLAPLTTFEPSLEPSPSIVAGATEAPRSKTRVRVYPTAFEAAWKAYPHHKGRSSKPNAATEWERLPPDERTGLLAAVHRFTPNVAQTCGGKGAPDMARWLRDGKHLGWLADEAATPAATFDGPPELRASVVSAKDEDFARRWLDHYCTWDPASRTLIARTPAIAATLRKDLSGWAERMKVTIATAANPAKDQAA